MGVSDLSVGSTFFKSACDFKTIFPGPQYLFTGLPHLHPARARGRREGEQAHLARGKEGVVMGNTKESNQTETKSNRMMRRCRYLSSPALPLAFTFSAFQFCFPFAYRSLFFCRVRVGID